MPQPSEQPLLTIIVPVYNRAQIVSRTLDSIAAQSLRPLHVVLVDNNSRDDSLSVLRRWKEENETADLSVTVLTEERRGAAATRNRGLGAVTTPLTMFFDSDDVMALEHCHEMTQCWLNNGQPDIVGRSVMIHLLTGRTKVGLFSADKPLMNHLFHGSLATQRYIVSTDLLRRVGAWDTRAMGWNDFELGIRLLLASPKIAEIPDGHSVTVYAQQQSITGTRFSTAPAKWEGALDLCHDDFVRAGRPELTLWIDVRRIILAAEYRREGARTDARRLLFQTLSLSSKRLRLRLLYLKHILYRRGTARLSRLIFPRVPVEV